MAEPTDKDARGATNLRIKFRSANLDEFIERYAVDVSKGGIFIRTREPLSVNTRLNLDFQLLEAAPLLEGEGTVVWIRQPDPSRSEVTPGMGVRFDKLTPESQARLDKILEEKERLSQAGKAAGSKSAGGIAVRRPTGAFLPTESASKPPPLPGTDHHPESKPASPVGHAPASEIVSKPVRQSPFLAGRARNTGAMSTFRAGAAQAFEPPTADDIDKALSVLEDKPGPVPAMPPPPRLSQDIPIQVTDDGSNEPTRVMSDPEEFGVHEAVTGRADVLPETGLPDAVPELKEAAIEDMTSRAVVEEEPTMAASPAAFAAAEVALGGGRLTTKAPSLDSLLGVDVDVPASEAPAKAKTVPPGRPGKALKKGSIVTEPQAPVESGRFRTNATYSRPRTTEKRVAAVVVVLAAIGGAGFAFRHRLAALFAKSEVAQLPVTPEPPPTPQPSTTADAAAATADAAVVVAPNPAVAPTVVEKPAPEPKPPVAKLLPPTPRPQPEARAKKRPTKAATGAIEVAPPPSEKPVPVAAETKPPGDTKPPAETPPPLPPTPEAPAAPAIAPMLRIASVPTGARVLIDGVPAGNTPLSIKDIDPNADHTLSIQKEGFETQERQFGPASWTRGKGAVSLKMNIKLKRVGAPAAPGTPQPDPNAPKEGGKPSDVEIITPDS